MSNPALARPFGPRAIGCTLLSRLLLVAALLIAGVTRLGWLRLIEFENDEAWALSIASSIARGRSLPLVGIGSSLNVPNAPFFVYLMALPELASRDPSLATGLIGLLGTAAVAATFGLASSIFDRPTGSVAALLYAVSPWGIIFSRKIWGQDALPLFVTLGFWALFASLVADRRRLIAPAILLLTLATQLHPTAFLLAAPALVLVISRIALDWPAVGTSLRWLGVGLFGSGLVESPFVYWQARHGWPLLQAVRRLVDQPGQLDLSAVRWAGSAVAGSGYPALAQVANVWKPAGFLEAGLLLIGLALLVRQVLRPVTGRGSASTACCPRPVRHRIIALTLLSWLAVPVLAQLHHSVPLYPHYFIVLYPAAFVVMALAVRWIAGWGGQRDATTGQSLAVAAVALPVGLGLVAFANYIGALQRAAVLTDFGVPLARQERLLRTANQLADGGPVYFGSHDSLAPALTYLGDGSWRIFDDRHGLRLPGTTRSAVLVISDHTSPAARLAGRWLAAERAATLDLTGWSTVRLYRLPPGLVERSPDYHVLDVPFDNGMVLTGFRLANDPAQRKLRIDLHWQFVGVPATKPPTVFNHLLDASGDTVSGRDGLAYDPVDWRPGEICLDEFDLAWPTAPGPYRLQVGLYDYPSMRRYHLLRPAPGAPVDSFDLGPVPAGLFGPR